MKRAIELAKKGTGWVNPNPLVGAVIVKDEDVYKRQGRSPRNLLCREGFP